jgi:NDP-hexose-3-ketoreductase
MEPVRFGIIACSSVARRRFLPALRNCSDAKLERIGSRDPTKAELFSREFGCGKFGDYDSVLADPDVEAIYISTPPNLHEEWVLRALSAGKHALCEKPAFPSFRAALNATNLARASKLRVIEGYSFKWHPQHAAVKSFVAENRIGEPRFFQADFTYPRPQPEDIRVNPELAGGVFGDSGGYPVAAALLHMPGPIESVYALSSHDPKSRVDQSLAILLQFKVGQAAQLLAGFDLYYRSRYAILGSAGRLEVLRAFAVPPEHQAAIALEGAAGEEKMLLPPADQFQLMLQDVCACIRGSSARNFESELLLQHAVLDAAARSQREQRGIPLVEYNL